MLGSSGPVPSGDVTPFSFETRARNIARLAVEPVDLLVIGAGINGAGIARDAARRGIQTALIDKADFGEGTSSRSSKLIHGGLRYLEQYAWQLVFEASRERRVLLQIAPHLVWPLAFIFPLLSGSRLPRWKLEAGLWLYDALSLFRNVKMHRPLSRRGVLRAEPGLRERELRGGARYFDAQCDDARLTLANVRDAHRHGCLVANYLEAARLDVVDGRVRGAHLTDRRTGKALFVRALVTVNATGPWSDTLRAAFGGGPSVRRTRGAHVAVPRARLGNRGAITFTSPVDGRVMFIIPWGDLSYVGTTDTDAPESPDRVAATPDDVVYLLRSANAIFPAARLQPADVVSVWAGHRPLLGDNPQSDPSAASREHRITETPPGLLSVLGGKLTTYRLIAEQVVDQVARSLHRMDGRVLPPSAHTDRHPLPGGEVRDLGLIQEELEHRALSPVTARHLVRRYGSEAPALLHLCRERDELARPIVPGYPAMLAEIVHGIHREMALTLSDLLVRRTHVFYECLGQGTDQAARVADVAARELGWSPEARAAQVEAYRAHVAQSRAPLAALGARLAG